MSSSGWSGVQQEPLTSIVSHLLEECRMVLPGITVFWERLSETDHRLHLLAIGLVAVAVAFVMTPAAYHRQVERDTIPRTFVVLSSRFLLCSIPPLMTGICLDFYLIGKLVLDDSGISRVFTILLFMAFIVPWFVVPRVVTLRKWIGTEDP